MRYYSASGPLLRVLFKIRPAASGSGFSVLLKMSRVLFSVWFSIQGIIQNTTCSIWFRIQRIIKKCPGYYAAFVSVFKVLFKIRAAASGSGFSVLFKNVHCCKIYSDNASVIGASVNAIFLPTLTFL